MTAKTISKNIYLPKQLQISALMNIQPTIIHFAHLLSSELHLEVEIVDNHLVRVAGSGPYNSQLGFRPNNNTRLLEHVIKNKSEQFIINSRSHPLCNACEQRATCNEMAFLGVPIIQQDQCLGVISLVAITPEQHQHLKKHYQIYAQYIGHISTMLVNNYLNSANDETHFNALFSVLSDHIDQAILILDESNKLKYINHHAVKILNDTKDNLINQVIDIRPLTFHKNMVNGNIQYVISVGKQKNLVIGQLHRVGELRLFIFAFHQSKQPLPNTLTANDAIPIDHFIGESKPIKDLKSLISRITPGSSSVLIIGESGTGKEVVARAIHRLSQRRDKPFITINCAAIPESLLESELFGYVKGAFTGASPNGKVGLIQSANEGTLFLDEIGDMPLASQAKLLRAIESREIFPIGSNKPIPVNIRIISATNQNLEQFIAEGKFREDLYYRLNVIPLQLPPLRERIEDIDLLIYHFLNLHTQRMNICYPGITAEVVQLLNQYPWPGNIRELSNLIEYLVNIVPNGGVIDTSLLPPRFFSSPATVDPSKKISVIEIKSNVQTLSRNKEKVETTAKFPFAEDSHTNLKQLEQQMIEEAINRLQNKRLVAEELGISVATLYRKIKKYHLD